MVPTSCTLHSGALAGGTIPVVEMEMAQQEASEEMGRATAPRPRSVSWVALQAMAAAATVRWAVAAAGREQDGKERGVSRAPRKDCLGGAAVGQPRCMVANRPRAEPQRPAMRRSDGASC
ncbi:Os03g0412051 [Oryza sativa Japonica Group]|uniref:Os03g0412051 protein n=1 Tax=Oryza sativa subsp. japonica TaxID=39947 RepID=A0A0P0VYL3_ORYSJ|nr:Os03g0412051 [Oryza sativa Japonica Group]